MIRISTSIILLILFYCSCGENKRKVLSITKAVFAIDATRPVIPSGFYPIVETPEYAIRRKLFSFEKDHPDDGKEFFLNPQQIISFANVDSISLQQDRVYNTNYYVLNIYLNLPGSYQLKALTSKANDITSNAYGQRIGFVANNTLVVAALNSGIIYDGVMQLSFAYSREDAEKMKNFFDKAVTISKANKEK